MYRTLPLTLVLLACSTPAADRPDSSAQASGSPAAAAPAVATSPGALSADTASAGTEKGGTKGGSTAASATPAAAVTPSAPGDLPIVRGLYVNRFAAQSAKRMRKLIAIADSTEVNALVIDVKDEFGLNIASQDPMVQKNAGKAGVIPNVRQLLDTLKAHQILAIARIVVFKDSVAARVNPNNGDSRIRRSAERQRNPSTDMMSALVRGRLVEHTSPPVWWFRRDRSTRYSGVPDANPSSLYRRAPARPATKP